MKQKTCLKAITPLLKQPFFTAEQARSLGVSAAALCHYVKTGALKRARRGVYQGINVPTSFLWEDLIQAVYSMPGSVVCLISALALYNLSEELPRQHWIGIRHGTSAKVGSQIKLVRFRNVKLGKTEIKVEGILIPIFDRERTIVDAFRLLSKETAIKALKAALVQRGKNKLDLVKLEEYAKQLRFDITPYLLSVTT